MSHKKGTKQLSTRFIIPVTLIVYLAIAFRFFHLQIIEHTQLKHLSEANRIRVDRLPPIRGDIVDRNGMLLATDASSYNVLIIPEHIKETRRTAPWIEKHLKVSESLFFTMLKNHLRKNPAFVPLLLKEDVTYDEVSAVETARLLFPELTVQESPVRTYPCGPACAHVVGYVGEISSEELEVYRNVGGYRSGDMVGKQGLELAYEKYLHGKEGALYTEIDSVGRRIRVVRKIPPKRGHTIITTLSRRLQETGYRIMRGKRGAIIAIKPATGEIIVAVSSPSYNPEIPSRPRYRNLWMELASSMDKPLLNRIIQGLYAPGSTFKTFVAITALEEGKALPDDGIVCRGRFRIGRRVFRDWKKYGHGRVNLKKAIEESCDVYFYRLGLLTGPLLIFKYAKMFGLGELTGIDIPGEKDGFVPNPAWKETQLKEKWTAGETAIMAIGQGYTLITPLQLALAYAGIAEGGKIYRPFIVKKIVDEKGRTLYERKPAVMREVPMHESTRDFILKALRDVVNGKHGTAKLARSRIVEIGGKTGTAQVVSAEEDRDELPEHLKDHAWFVGLAPALNPEIVVAVIVENGGSGGAVAAPIAKKIIETYFTARQAKNAER